METFSVTGRTTALSKHLQSECKIHMCHCLNDMNIKYYCDVLSMSTVDILFCFVDFWCYTAVRGAQ